MSYLEDRNKRKLGLLPPLPTKKERKQLAKKSPKKIEEEKKEREERGENDTELQRWFKQKVKISSGFCSECGCVVEKNIFKYAVMTIAHLLPKRDNMCPSVRTHPLNFIILCPDHHHQFDNSNWDEREKMGCWPIVMERLVMVYPDLAPEERRHFPSSVLKWMEKNEPF